MGQSGGSGCAVSKFRILGGGRNDDTGGALWERVSGSARPRWREARWWGKSQSTAGMGCVCGDCPPRCHLPRREGIILGEKGGKSQLYLPRGAIPAHTHTHTGGRHTRCWVVPVGHAYLQAGYTPSLQEGETRAQGPWWWTTEKRSGGEGNRNPGGRIQSQNKKKRWRMESKNRTKNCQLNTGGEGGGARTSTPHAAHTGGRSAALPAPW